MVPAGAISAPPGTCSSFVCFVMLRLKMQGYCLILKYFEAYIYAGEHIIFSHLNKRDTCTTFIAVGLKCISTSV